MKFPKVALGLAATAMIALAGCNGNNPDNVQEEGSGARNINYQQTTDNTGVDDRTRNRDAVDERMNDDNNRDQRQYDVSAEAADKITAEVPDINNVYVLTTDNNAYVAASWDKGEEGNTDKNAAELDDDTKKKITDVVKSVDSDIDNVYISTNPDFFELSGQYINDMENGQPVEGFFGRIGNMIERVFPDDRAR
ncbi:YhcN/YlaJ family sporulation lipoprotein [Gracilibacillus alcaliphilus]|uniref:YhcN/YlaJ family sporulation lipoprotein n=1 Tax=Gracilibacillus alcaliphilus TaxID=1401441 RepID=UPI00195B39B6|nr:YhcN/YlaJ family sporulation lipoprotein [Gracilibacillus alcaliphilus]MBM7675344.1 YhcN/YlaJ family sporulation lipoprotein [Gracilibacillus alcaliphilus]